MNQKSPKISTPSKQHVAVGLEDTALNKDAAVTEEVSLALFIELKQKFGQIAGHLHVYALDNPARERRDEGYVTWNHETAKVDVVEVFISICSEPKKEYTHIQDWPYCRHYTKSTKLLVTCRKLILQRGLSTLYC